MSFLTFPLHAFTGCLLRIHVICKSLNRNWLSNPTWESSNWLSQKEKLEMNAWLISLICSISLICYRWKSLTIPSTPSKLKCGILVWEIKKKYWKSLSPPPLPLPKERASVQNWEQKLRPLGSKLSWWSARFAYACRSYRDRCPDSRSPPQ